MGDLVRQYIADVPLSRDRPDQIAADEFLHYLCDLHYCTEIRSSKAINSG
jgi:hypothetical protein